MKSQSIDMKHKNTLNILPKDVELLVIHKAICVYSNDDMISIAVCVHSNSSL